MKHKAILIPIFFCALVPPFAALRWNPKVPNFLPEEILPDPNMDAAFGQTAKLDDPGINQIDIASLGKRFTPPAPMVKAPAKPQAPVRPKLTINRAIPVEEMDTLTAKPEERRYLGIIRDENNIAHIFHRDIKSGNLIREKEAP